MNGSRAVPVASLAAVLASLAVLAVPGTGRAQAAPAARAAEDPVYVVYYWRARPGKAAEYARYIREVAEPIDEEARKMGAFEELRTYTQFLTTGAPGSDWTHVRVFRLRSFAQLDSLSIKLDQATARLYPDPERRRAATSGRSADLRDLVRQEIWRGFR